MNILTKWLRSYLPELPVDDRQLAEDLTLRGIAVEGEFDAACGGRLYEMDITTNRVDAMNHYGVAREAAAILEYFAALGQKPISAPVDVTNFGWLAMGQPTHVFDLDAIVGGIVVRRARAGEKLQLLDGTERTLVAEDLVIADEVKALGLAGVMGGWASRVTDEEYSRRGGVVWSGGDSRELAAAWTAYGREPSV